MSESMSEREIEDVLNSVRRLVAQAERRSRPAPLVLTPDMRVDAPEAGQADQTGQPDAGGTPDAADATHPVGPSDATEAAAPHEAGEPVEYDPDVFLPATRGPEPSAPALLDERALQDLVGQIVRDELQGKLGERITHAVRKLVRNEIARALDEERRKH